MKGKRGGRTALSSRAYARSVSWRIDQDYLHQLSPDEAGWLAGFLDRHYGADHRPDGTGHDWPVDERRESYRQKNAANRDLYAQVATRDGFLPEEALSARPADELDWSPLPAHLDDPRYRPVRERLREHPHDDLARRQLAAWREEDQMSKPRKPLPEVDPDALVDALAPAPPAREEDDLPLVEWLTLARVKGGWVVLRCDTRGRTVISEEALCQVGTKDRAVNVFRVEAARRYLLPGAP